MIFLLPYPSPRTPCFPTVLICQNSVYTCSSLRLTSWSYFLPYMRIPEFSCALHLLNKNVILLWGTIICALRSQYCVVIEFGGLESLSRFGIWLSHLLWYWENYLISLYFSFLICKIEITIELPFLNKIVTRVNWVKICIVCLVHTKCHMLLLLVFFLSSQTITILTFFLSLANSWVQDKIISHPDIQSFSYWFPCGQFWTIFHKSRVDILNAKPL